ncbi:MAG: AsnC family protein, partial [Bacteroidetes bacterium]|nr:AsnC family protein [Bacteroidota bacterium]
MVRTKLEHLDKTDRKILNILQDDGSTSNVELARRIKLAPATT